MPFNDSLGREKRLSTTYKKAKIPTKMTTVVYRRTLLTACAFRDNLTLGESVTRKITETENIYASLIRFRFIELNLIPVSKIMKLVKTCLMDQYGEAVLNGIKNENMLVFDPGRGAHDRQTLLGSLSKEMDMNKNLIILDRVNDSQKQKTRNVNIISSCNVMQIIAIMQIDQPRAVTLANDLDKRYDNKMMESDIY